MERNKYNFRFIQFISLILLVLIMIPCIFAIENKDEGTFADSSDNQVFFEQQSVEASANGLIYVDITAEGVPGATVNATYRTESISAIPGIDYENVTNTISLKIGNDGKVVYKLAFKSLNTAANREKLRLYSNSPQNTAVFGRCFKVVIVAVENAIIYEAKKSCVCSLTYENKVSATTGETYGGIGGGEVAYINDYKTLQAYYHKGVKNLDGKETWKSWKNGKISFENDTTALWNNAYYKNGFGDLYASYLIRVIDNSSVHSGTDIKIYAGNKEFISKYDDSSSTPGLYLYLSCEPHAIDDADRIDGRVMYLVTKDKNPYKEDSDYADVTNYTIKSDYKRYYWIQGSDAWYASKNTLYNSMFYKINPYNGVFDAGVAVYNKNKEVDIEAKDIWAFMALIDDKCPTVVGQYVDDSMLKIDGKLRFYIRFSEPVYTSKKGTLDVKFNSSSNAQQATYVAGNYSDTLVYEITAPKTNITSITYQFPTNDIGDMAYNLDAYKNVQNNKLQNTDQNRNFEFLHGPINNISPRLSVDLERSTSARNIYNLLVSINNNGEVPLYDGTIYYDWKTSNSAPVSEDPAAYSKSYELKEEDSGSFNVSLAKNETEGVESGTYYLYALAVSKYGLTQTAAFGPYLLDGDPPAVNFVVPTDADNELQRKIFTLNVEGTDTNEVALLARWKGSDNELHTEKLVIVKDGQKVASLGNRVEIVDGGSTITYKYKSNIDTTDPTIAFDDFIQELMGDEIRMYFDMSFNLTDSAGNSVASNIVRVVYDKRAYFEVNPTIAGTKIGGITTMYDAYDISGNKTFKITLDLANPSTDLTPGTAFSVLVNGEDSYEAPSTDTDTVEITLSNAGFYELVPRITGNDSESTINIVSKAIRFYLTDGLNDITTNYDKINSNLVLSNKVFQIQDARYYYLNEDGTIVNSYAYGSTYNDVTGKYDGGSSAPTFSNTSEAKKYVKFMEYRDMYLVSLTANMASLLNSSTGSTIYVKAANETMVAQEGQLWIRYKKSTWTTASTSFGWAFYYYGNGLASEGININGLSANLTDALNKVVNRITSVGKEINLVEEDQLNTKTGAPYLAANQIHVAPEEAETSMAGSTYLVKPTYSGDVSLYQNKVTIDNVQYSIATNLIFDIDENTFVYYRYIESEIWEQLNLIEGRTLSDMFGDKASGIYKLREYSSQGVCEYNIYFDKTTPTLTIDLNGVETILDGTVVKLSGSNVVIKSLNAEIDPYGYVAIYTYPSKALKTVLYKDDINPSNGYELDSANYYLQVGDRSGNMTIYTLLLSSSLLEVTATENTTNTGIYIKVLNREESEIYSYEVYLNEMLVSSEFAESKLYKDPGIYRIVVTDIYGNTVTTTKEFEFASPEIIWYYLNASGSYSRYDSSKPVNMIIRDDATSSRISNVYTSSLIRMMFNTNYGDSEIKFEILDIGPTDYTYSESTGVITITTLTGWRMRTWFADYPENDHLYVCKVDTEAPDFKASFVGTSYGVYVEYDAQGNVVKTSSVDNMDLTNYEEGDVLSVDTLAYAIGSTSTIEFFNGNVINGNHIIIELNDPSDIKSYSVTRNGQQVTATLDTEGQIILNGYGTYVVTAIDSLGNTGTFTFVNTKDPISEATIDSEELKDSVLEYGNSDVVIETKYAGRTSFLVNDGQEKSTYVFEFDGNTLTYGRYICTIELVEDEGDILVEQKSGEYVQATGFYLSLNDENIKKNRWYSVITTDNYVIYAMFNDASHACYKIECVESLIQVEATFYVGNNVFPSYYKADLSKATPEVRLLTGGTEVEILPDSAYIYIAKELTIDETSVSEDITSIKVSYAQLPYFESYETIYEDGEFKTEFVGDDYGFYAILVENKYNTQHLYIVSRIDAFVSQVRVTYQDGTTRDFTTNPSYIYSNAMVELIVYSQNVHFEVNGEEYSGISKDGTIVLELDKFGLYNVKVVAANGIAEYFNFNIGTNPEFVYNEAWISGYNEEALLRDQGYTNKLLTIEPVMGIEYVDYIYNNNDPTIIYDNISENPINNPEAFIDAIGVDGPGVYVVRFRNLNGDLAVKTIHYNNIPSLELSRKTVAKPNNYEEYKISDAVRINFYSNYIMKFETKSVRYDFKVNGNSVSLDTPWIVEFSATSGNGSFEYLIDYIDEYGNKINFKAVLYRADVEISTSQMVTKEINGNLYTKDNVVITFAEGLKALVQVNDREPVVYNSGDIFYKDGVYIFTIRDIAGNINVYTVTHKSVNAYTMIDSTTNQPIIQGGVVNNTSVQFTATDDSSVKSIFKNGEKVESLDVKTFATTGHWEVIVEDLVGNQSYSEFYVINNSLSHFEYTAPYDYQISEVWYTDKQGKRSQIEITGDTIELVENGDYAVIVLGKEFTTSFQFSVEIDNTPPQAVLEGVENGGVTANNVTVKGLKVGDVVEVYKDGKLVEKLEVSLSSDTPSITTGGEYRIVVTNIQGSKIEYNFTRKSIANTAASIFIIILCLAAVIGVAIGLVYHTGLKTDS